jgi:hypothetical protein
MFNGECLSDLGFYHQNDPLFKDGLMSSEIDKNRFETAQLNLGNPVGKKSLILGHILALPILFLVIKIITLRLVCLIRNFVPG